MASDVSTAVSDVNAVSDVSTAVSDFSAVSDGE